MRSVADEIDQQGYTIIHNVIALSELDPLRKAFSFTKSNSSIRSGETFGVRNILSLPEIHKLSQSTEIQNLLYRIISDGQVVRGVFFDKTPKANWPVAWHQDLTLAVTARYEIQGWTAWSIKAGIHHVQPPVGLLERMIILRIHLDDCDEENGPLRVLPTTHKMGRLSRDQIKTICREIPEAICIAKAGDVAVMRPLLLHASSPAHKPEHRRVIQFECAPINFLPKELN